jgi:hypothetical protein
MQMLSQYQAQHVLVGVGSLSVDAALEIPDLPTFIGNLNLAGNVLTLTSNISASCWIALIKIRGEAFVDYAVSNPLIQYQWRKSQYSKNLAFN